MIHMSFWRVCVSWDREGCPEHEDLHPTPPYQPIAFFFFQHPSLCPFNFITTMSCSHRFLMKIHLLVTEGNEHPDRLRGNPAQQNQLCQGTRVAPDLPQRWTQMGGTLGHAVSISVGLLPGLTMGQMWRNKENKDEILLQAGWTDTEGCLVRDLRLSSPRFSASTPSRLSFNGTVQLVSTTQTASRTTETGWNFCKPDLNIFWMPDVMTNYCHTRLDPWTPLLRLKSEMVCDPPGPRMATL